MNSTMNDNIKPGRKLLMGTIFGEALGVVIGAATGHIGLGGLAILIEHSQQPYRN